MRRLLTLVSLASLLVVGCGATYNKIGTVTMTVPTNDNAELVCANPPTLIPVPSSTSRVMHLRCVQGAFAWEDSISTTAATSSVSFTTIPNFPNGTTVTLIGWASDSGGAGCPVSVQWMPTVMRIPPAVPTIQ